MPFEKVVLPLDAQSLFFRELIFVRKVFLHVGAGNLPQLECWERETSPGQPLCKIALGTGNNKLTWKYLNFDVQQKCSGRCSGCLWLLTCSLGKFFLCIWREQLTLVFSTTLLGMSLDNPIEPVPEGSVTDASCLGKPSHTPPFILEEKTYFEFSGRCSGRCSGCFRWKEKKLTTGFFRSFLYSSKAHSMSASLQ